MTKEDTAGGGTTATPPAKVAVPDVSGKSVADATALLADKGLKFAQGPSETSDTVGRGFAIRQTPDAGTEAEQGSTVTVVFSAGRSAFPVPDVIGKSESAARKALEGTSANFKVKDETIEKDSPEKKGTVIDISPDRTGEYPAGTVFTLTVSTGVENIEVPSVVTQTQDDATNTLKQLGFRVGYATADNPGAPDQTVLQQSVKAGTKAPKGTLITLTINDHEEQPTPPPSSPTPTPTDTPPTTLPTTPGLTIGG